jgi:methionyl-tRNA formyltransferase
MRIVICSMNDIGRYAIEELAKRTPVVGLFTVKERGKLYMDPTDYTELAKHLNIPLYRQQDINAPEVEAQMRALKPDFCMTIGWKQIIKKNLLDIPVYGWIGGHPTKLLFPGEKVSPDTLSAPGNEPLNYAIRGGYRKTAMTLFWLKEKIDNGELFARGEIGLDPHETSATLLEKMGRMTAKLVLDNMQAILDGKPPRIPQEPQTEQPYMKPLKADENKIDLAKSPEETDRLIRSEYYPYPNAFIDFYGQRIYIEHARFENNLCTELKVRAGGTPWGK